MTNLPENIIVEARDVSFSYPEEPDRHVLKTSLGTSVALLMITELFASTSGLGYFIMNSMDARKYPEMYSGILLLMGMSALMYAFLEIAERLLCRWRYGSPINA